VSLSFEHCCDVQLCNNITYACASGVVIDNVQYGFEMTVSLDEPIKQRLLLDILVRLVSRPKCSTSSSFVVRDDMFDDLKAQRRGIDVEKGHICEASEERSENQSGAMACQVCTSMSVMIA
jgi:hypothetical protein